MALKDGMQGREYDKFVADTSGNTAIRTSLVQSDANVFYATGAYTNVAGTEVPISGLNNQDINGREGSWFVYNSGATSAITFKMYAAYVTGATDWAAATDAQWDQVGSDISVSAGATKHIPFTNTYRSVTLTAVATGSTTSHITAQLYAVN
tara:strand:+ start:30 stop:482 length:453 start_codon:yes stop_codon:yes gene_type:complete